MRAACTNLQSIVSIFSAGHSGSTLLALMIASHPKAFYVGEFHALPRWINENKICGCGSSLKNCNFWRDLSNRYEHRHDLDFFLHPKKLKVYESYNILASRNYIRKIHRGITYLETSYNSLFFLKSLAQFRWNKIVRTTMNIYDLISEASGAKIIVDSTKSYLRTFKFSQHYPSLIKVLFLVRDGRAVCHSNITKLGFTMERAAKIWKNTYNRASKIFSHLPKECMLLMKYEDLCNSPKAEARRVAQFLSLTFEPEMLEISRGLCHSIAGNDMKWKPNAAIKLNEKWKMDLSLKDLECFDSIAGSINRKFGYLHYSEF